MGIQHVIAQLESYVENPAEGLPEAVFQFVSRMTPLVNVDLWIRNEAGHSLLTWREDGFYAPSWHVPGGIVRFQERLADRILAVAAGELGTTVKFDPDPVAMNEFILPNQKTRGHGISFLYGCSLLSAPNQTLRYLQGDPKPGQWAWHKSCPDNLIEVQEAYQSYLG